MLHSFFAVAASILPLISASSFDLEVSEGLPDTGLDISSWTLGQTPPIADLVDLNDMQLAAKNYLSAANYAEYRTAALDEITYIRNLIIWQNIRLNGFTFQDVSNVNLATTILGYNFSLPFFLAPAADAGLANSGAEANLVQAAAQTGILYIPSISSTLSIEQIAAANSSNQTMFHQEYIWSDQTRLQTELNEFSEYGFKAVVLTVDNTGINGIRDRSLRFTSSGDTGHSATFTLQALAQLRTMTNLPIVPKGIKTAHDAKLCAELGFPAIYLSNHGGRVVDGVPTIVEVLLDIHANYPEIFGQLEIWADGGVRRGTHVLTLLALGVRAVGLGRPTMFSNIYGTTGVTTMINMLETEITTEMKLMGQSDINGWRGNTTFINTRQLELEYFGAPLGVSTSSTPFAWSSPPTTDTLNSVSNHTARFFEA